MKVATANGTEIDMIIERHKSYAGAWVVTFRKNDTPVFALISFRAFNYLDKAIESGIAAASLLEVA